MKAIRFPFVAALLGVGCAIDCHFEHPIHKDVSPTAEVLSPKQKNAVSKFCTEHVNVEDILTFQEEDISFQIVPVQDGAKLSPEECSAAFDSIFSLCIRKNHVWGGDFITDNLIFDLHHTHLRQRDIDDIGFYGEDGEDDIDMLASTVESGTNELPKGEDPRLANKNLVRRRARGGRTKRPRPSRPKKTQKKTPKKTQKKTPKKTPKKNQSSRKKAPSKSSNRKGNKSKTHRGLKPTSKPNAHASKTQSRPSSKTKTTSKKSEPSLSCKVLNQQVRREFAALARSDNLVKRNEIEPLTDRSSQLVKRASPKSALGCRVYIKANNYPERGEMSTNALAYGYSMPNTCLNFQFVGGPYHRRQQSSIESLFDVEHTLEWSTVTNFWTWLNDKLPRRPNPEPGRTKDVDFCDFWRKVWNESPAIPVGGRTLTPNQHIAHFYPSATGYKDEFAFLQDTLNQVPKKEMWSRKSTAGIYAIVKTTDLISGPTTTLTKARKGMIKLKALLGAHSYMKTPKVNAILGKEKTRIGKILGGVDEELPRHQRTKNGRSYTAWQRLGLKKQWDTYMDEKFAKAVSRTQYTMDTHLRQAEQRWIKDPRNRQPDQQTPQHRELRDLIRAVAKRWRKDRNSWKKPANWGVSGGVPKNRHPKVGAGVGDGADHLQGGGLP